MFPERALIVLLVVISSYQLTTGFKWSALQQASHVISIPINDDVTLPCDFVLTSEERQSLDQFYIITWSKEVPMGSNSWAGTAIRSSVLQPQVISGDKDRIRLENNSLVITNVKMSDHAQYMCEVRSSFYTTPSKLQLDVMYKPVDTRITIEANNISPGEAVVINCTSKANPPAKYGFFLNGKLQQNSSSNQFIVENVNKAEHDGRYGCVAWNTMGEGETANLDITVKEEATRLPKTENPGTILTVEIIAAIAGVGGFLIIVIIVLSVIIFHKSKSVDKVSERSPRPRTNKSITRDANEAYVGPGIYGSQSLEGIGTAGNYGRNQEKYPQFTSSLSLNGDGVMPTDTQL